MKLSIFSDITKKQYLSKEDIEYFLQDITKTIYIFNNHKNKESSILSRVTKKIMRKERKNGTRLHYKNHQQNNQNCQKKYKDIFD